MPNGVDWVRIAAGAHPHRRGAGAAEHPAAAPGTGRAAARRLRAASGHRRGVPRPPLPRRAVRRVGDRRSRRRGPATPGAACAAPGLDARGAARPPTPEHGAPAWSTRWPPPSRRATRWSSCSPRAAAECPRASCTPTATRCARCAPAWRRAASTPTPGSTCRCRSSGSAASAAACSPRCWPAPRWSPNPRPSRETTLRLLERERVTLFRGWPDQAEALARQRGFGRRRPVRAAAGQPRSAAARRAARPPGRAGEAVRHDRVVRPVLRLPRRHRHAGISVGQLRQAVRRHGGSHRRRRRPERPFAPARHRR